MDSIGVEVDNIMLIPYGFPVITNPESRVVIKNHPGAVVLLS